MQGWSLRTCSCTKRKSFDSASDAVQEKKFKTLSYLQACSIRQPTISRSSPSDDSSLRSSEAIIGVRPRGEADGLHCGVQRDAACQEQQSDVIQQGVAVVLWMRAHIAGHNSLAVRCSSTPDTLNTCQHLDTCGFIKTVGRLKSFYVI